MAACAPSPSYRAAGRVFPLQPAERRWRRRKEKLQRHKHSEDVRRTRRTFKRDPPIARRAARLGLVLRRPALPRRDRRMGGGCRRGDSFRTDASPARRGPHPPGIVERPHAPRRRDAIEKLAADARRAKKIFAIHCSERVREEIDAVLDLKPAFLVHMIHATDADLERCADAHVPIVICPRSNAFFGMTPDIPRMLRCGVELHLGTDNAMINTPSLLREMEFAYRVARMKGGVPARDILDMALRGRHLADSHATSGIRVGARADLVILDLPGGRNGFASVVRASASDVRLVVSGGRLWPAPSPSVRDASMIRGRRRRIARSTR